VVLLVTNLTIAAYPMSRPPRLLVTSPLLLGTPPSEVPDFLTRNRGVYPLIKRERNLQRYNDNACFMRCLALHRGATLRNLEAPTKQLIREYAECSLAEFQGLSLNEIDNIEDKFKVNIDIFSLFIETDGSLSAKLIRRSSGQYDQTLNCNLYENHFSYIHDLRRYTRVFICSKCDKGFKTSRRCSCHMTKCNGGTTNIKYPGGNYRPPPTLRQKLKDQGIDLPDNLKFHPYHIVYDIESYFPEQNDVPQNPTRLVYTEKHIPLSVGVYSNVPGHNEGKCHVTAGDTHELVKNMIDCMISICDTSRELLTAEAEEVFELIDLKLEEIRGVDEKAHKHPLVKLKDELEKYINIIPVVGFSSSRYDLNVLRPFLLPHLKQGTCIIKKTNQYLSLSSDRLKFLDIQNYLAPNYSYKQYLAAYQSDVTKSFFPYSYVKSLDCLKETKLPDRQYFYSELTGTTISQEDYDECLAIWKAKDMKTFKDWLVFYNLTDIIPLSNCLIKHSAFFKERNIDMLNDGLSLPGLCDRFLHDTLPENCFFSLFNQKNSDIFIKLRENTCGGPSLTFKRKIEKGDPLRGHDPQYQPHKKCETILGIDANSLYLYCMSKEMPTGNYYRRRAENGFKLESQCSKQSIGCLEWLTYLETTEGRNIQHLYKNGRERSIGGRNIRVDGFDVDDETIFQYHGCYFHGHGCRLNARMSADERTERSTKTEEITKYLEKLGFTVVVMRECEWMDIVKTDSSIERLEPKGPAWTYNLTQEQILTLILSGDLFAFIEVDIEVPEHLRDKFAEFPPIFKNCMIGIDDIGEHMKAHCQSHNLLKQPRRSLISSFYGSKIMFTTPLLRWYLQHGLRVTNIYQLVQYDPKPCFQNFVSQVTEARRSADIDPNKAIIGSAFKLLGNSAYGRSLMRKDRHLDTSICTETEAQEAINDPRFHHMIPIDDTHFEVFKNKKSILMNTPIAIGFQVYNLAKLELLKCYYDFLDKFIDRSSFELSCCDTDSLYFALSTSTIDEAVKPALKDYFKRIRGTLLPAERCLSHPDIPEPLACCKAYKKHQEREPGLWKIEAQCDSIISLSPKCYICVGGSIGSKLTAKGVQKRINELQFKHFAEVLRTKGSHSVTNRGFRLDGQHNMSSYVQPKIGLSYTYIKRIVAEDGITTFALDL